jgi:phage tail protein X
LRTTPANGGKLIGIVLERAIGLASSSFHHILRIRLAPPSARPHNFETNCLWESSVLDELPGRY